MKVLSLKLPLRIKLGKGSSWLQTGIAQLEFKVAQQKFIAPKNLFQSRKALHFNGKHTAGTHCHGTTGNGIGYFHVPR